MTWRRTMGWMLAMAAFLMAGRAAGSDWTEEALLRAADGSGGDEFGFSISVSGSRAIVGACSDDDLGENSGSAYIFGKGPGGWVQMAKIRASDTGHHDYFGASVAISGTRAVVGTTRGKTYIFEEGPSGWTETAKLLAGFGGHGDTSGPSVAMCGSTVVVGNAFDDDFGTDTGAAYVFERGSAGWAQTAKLAASDHERGDQFGVRVDVSGSTIVVGANGDDDLGDTAGSAYVFERDSTGWGETAKLLASDGVGYDYFGNVAVSGSTVIVGAQYDDDLAANSGSAYVFGKTATGWVQTGKLLPADGATWDCFGYSVDVSGSTAVVGALNDDDLGDHAGSAYVFRKGSSGWVQTGKLLASNGARDDRFGRSVALDGATVVVGAYGNGGSGSAYVFTPEPATLALLAAGLGAIIVRRRRT